MALRPRDLTLLVVMLAGCAGLAGLGDFQDVGTGGASSTDGGASTVGGGGGGTASGGGGSGGAAPEPMCGDGRLDPGEECDHPNSSFCTAGCKVDCNAWFSAAKEGGNRHCYLVVTSITLSQPDAEAACAVLAGAPGERSTLVGFDSFDELAELPAIPDTVWTSGSDQGTEGIFRWTNGDPWVFAPWYVPDGEPDGGTTQNCVVYRTEGAIATQVCNNPFGYICELFPPVAQPRCGDGVIQDDEACDDGNAVSGDGCADCQVECVDGLIDPDTHRCYLTGAASSWNMIDCPAGYYPATISTTEEMRALFDLEGTTWTGGHYSGSSFVWQNGEPFIAAVWQGSPPPTPQSNEAILIDPKNSVLLLDTKGSNYSFLCERPPAGRY